VICDYIDHYRDRFGVEPICRVLSAHGVKIAPSTYYVRRARPVSDADWADAHLVNVIVDIYRSNRSVYGVLKVWHQMRRQGYLLGRDQVARLMAVAGLVGVRRGGHHTVTTSSDPTAARSPDLIKRAWNTPTRPDQWWVADFTYVWTRAGFCYVSFVTDVYSRRILGWRVSRSKTTPLVTSAFEQALFARRRHDSRFDAAGLVHHSDAGSQYTSIAFTQALADAGIAPSIGTVGDALDNALMESNIGLYKTELIDLGARRWDDYRQVEAETANWVYWFNTTRLHSSIGYLAPIEYEQRYWDHFHASNLSATKAA
jgi:transposase InsO family protein